MSGPITPPLTVETLDGATTGRPITTIKVSNGDLTVAGNVATIDTSGGGGGGTGTVTSISIKDTSGTSSTAITTAGSFQFVGAGTTSTAVVGTVLTITSNDQFVGTVQGVTSGGAPLDVDNTDAANPVISMTQSGASVDGWLSSTNWNTFNNKQATLSLTTTGTSGAATLVGATLNIPQYSGGGGGTITGSITDTQVAFGDTTANSIQGNVKLTYAEATQSLNIAAGTGTGTILSGSSDMVIRNSSATAHSKITLTYDAANSDIKLDTDGTGLVEIHKEGSLAYSLPNVVTTDNGYVLTAQTDGSTAWAASGGGGGGFTGSLTDTQLAFGDTTADSIQGSARLTFEPSGTGATLTIGEAGTNYPRLAIRGNNGFINFQDGSNNATGQIGVLSATTGITFKTTASNTERLRISGDGSFGLSGANYGTSGQVITSSGAGSPPTWTTVGGTSGAVLPATILDSGTLDLFLVSKMGLWGNRTSSAGTYNGTATPHFFPFINPKAGDIEHISINVSSDGTGVYGFAIYRDLNGAPVTKLGGDMSYTGGTGGTGREDLTPSSTVTLEANTQYWIGVVETSTGNTALTAESGNDVCSAHPISSSTSNLAAIATLASLTLSGSSNTLPISITASDLSGDFTPQIRWGIVYQ